MSGEMEQDNRMGHQHSVKGECDNGECTELEGVAFSKAEQEEFRLKFLEQIKRMSCPGCGEGDLLEPEYKHLRDKKRD